MFSWQRTEVRGDRKGTEVWNGGVNHKLWELRELSFMGLGFPVSEQVLDLKAASGAVSS